MTGSSRNLLAGALTTEQSEEDPRPKSRFFGNYERFGKYEKNTHKFTTKNHEILFDIKKFFLLILWKRNDILQIEGFFVTGGEVEQTTRERKTEQIADRLGRLRHGAGLLFLLHKSWRYL